MFGHFGGILPIQVSLHMPSAEIKLKLEIITIAEDHGQTIDRVFDLK